MMTRPHAFLALALLLALSACSRDKSPEKPAELVRFEATGRAERAWSAGVSGAAVEKRLGLGLALTGETVFAAGADGDVAAFNAKTGQRMWRTETKLRLTGGPGAGEGIVMAGGSHGDIVALDATDGAVKWKAQVNSEVLSAPAISEGVAALRLVDGRLVLLRLTDGSQVWSAEQQVPRLSLRGTGTAAIAGGIAVSGFDNGRVMALNVVDGSTAWELGVAPPTGRTELDRLVDIDSNVRIVGDEVYVVTYQGRVARILRETGQLSWSRDLSSHRGLAVDVDGVYIATSDGQVIKIGRSTGVELWKQDALSRRGLSAPAALGSHVAVGDLEGQVHFLDSATGAMVARIGIGGDRVVAAPVVFEDLAIFLDASGRITALRIKPLPQRAAASSAPSANPAAAATDAPTQ